MDGTVLCLRKDLHMLVLSRQRDETIMIGDDIEVTVVDIRGDKVRLGINAPKVITVHRKEVYDAIRRENRAAAQVKPEDLSGLGKVGPKAPGQPQSLHPTGTSSSKQDKIEHLKREAQKALSLNMFTEAQQHLCELQKLAA